MPAPREIRRQQQRSRSLLHALARTSLQEAGERLAAVREAESRELEQLGQHVATALRSGLGVTEIAELTGLSRQKVYELRDAHSHAPDDLRTLLLIQLAARGGQSVEALAADLKEDEATVRSLIDALQADGLVHAGYTSYDPTAVETWILITPTGEEHLERLLRTTATPRRMPVYVSFDSADLDALRDAAVGVFGTEPFGIVEPAMAHDVELPELAFHVVAVDADEAIAAARRRMAELRTAAGLSPAPLPPVIVVEG